MENYVSIIIIRAEPMTKAIFVGDRGGRPTRSQNSEEGYKIVSPPSSTYGDYPHVSWMSKDDFENAHRKSDAS